MKQDKCFISGKISGCEDYKANFIAGETVVKYLLCCAPVSPVTDKKMPYWCYMVRSVWMMLGCKNVYFLSDYRESRGARIEYLFAKLFRKHISIPNINSRHSIERHSIEESLKLNVIAKMVDLNGIKQK